MMGEQQHAKVKSMRRVFNYKLKEYCIRYIKSSAVLERVCYEYQAIDVVEDFQRGKLQSLNLRAKI